MCDSKFVGAFVRGKVSLRIQWSVIQFVGAFVRGKKKVIQWLAGVRNSRRAKRLGKSGLSAMLLAKPLKP